MKAKRLFLALLLTVIVTQLLYAQQWLGSPTNTGSINRPGKVILNSPNWDDHLEISRYGFGGVFKPDHSVGYKGLRLDLIGDGSNFNILNGNLGIGTTTPQERVTVNGNIFINGGYPKLNITPRLTLQVPADAGNGYTRSFLAQNLTWNEASGKWAVPDQMYTDFSMLRFENSGTIGFYTAGSSPSPELTNNELGAYRRLGIDYNGNVGVSNHLGVGGNVGIGNGNTMNGISNGGLHIMKGGHSSLVLGEPQQGYGGFLQTSDARHRVFLGANIYDDQDLGWRSIQPTKGAAGISLVADEGDWGTSIGFYLSQDGSLSERMSLFSNGIVSIGATSGYYSYNITNTDYKLYVEKGIRTRKIKVDQANWADYVFEPTYKLPTLKRSRSFYNTE